MKIITIDQLFRPITIDLFHLPSYMAQDSSLHIYPMQNMKSIRRCYDNDLICLDVSAKHRYIFEECHYTAAIWQQENGRLLIIIQIKDVFNCVEYAKSAESYFRKEVGLKDIKYATRMSVFNITKVLYQNQKSRVWDTW